MELYQRLIDGIPEGIGVKSWGMGRRWSYVESVRGTGVAMTVGGGRGMDKRGASLGGRPALANSTELKVLAAFALSWCFEEASIGVAALNAWYNNADNNPALNASLLANPSGPGAGGGEDSRHDNGTAQSSSGPGAGSGEDTGHYRQSDILESEIQAFAGRKVAVIGHFPLLDELAAKCQLSVLERNPSGSDFPDSACEYILPEQDLVLITGTALTNKTMPRLLELSRNARTVLLGPSCVCSSVFFEYGVDLIGATTVVDSAQALPQLAHGTHLPFGQGLEMVRFHTSFLSVADVISPLADAVMSPAAGSTSAVP